MTASAYSEHCQPFLLPNIFTEFSPKVLNDETVIIFAKRSILEVWEVLKYVAGNFVDYFHARFFFMSFSNLDLSD